MRVEKLLAVKTTTALQSLTDLTLLRINPQNYLDAQIVASEKQIPTTKKVGQGFFFFFSLLSLSRGSAFLSDHTCQQL